VKIGARAAKIYIEVTRRYETRLTTRAAMRASRPAGRIEWTGDC